MSLKVTVHNHVAIISLNRPEVYHAINREMLNKLQETLNELRYRREIRVLVITGEGDKAFCSGADLKERRTMSETEVRQYIDLIGKTFQQVEEFPKPVIAAINGLALGGGTELALACDLRFISDQAMMGLTEVTLGILPGAGGTQRLPRIVGKSKAKDLIFTGRKVSAEEAIKIGLADRLIPHQSLMEETLQYAEQIAENAPLAVSQAKWAINNGLEVSLQTGLEMESKAYQVLIPTKDRLEGLNAFREKRKPVYSGE